MVQQGHNLCKEYIINVYALMLVHIGIQILLNVLLVLKIIQIGILSKIHVIQHAHHRNQIGMLIEINVIYLVQTVIKFGLEINVFVLLEKLVLGDYYLIKLIPI
jgi:cyanophycinase-like exopeptidase